MEAFAVLRGGLRFNKALTHGQAQDEPATLSGLPKALDFFGVNKPVEGSKQRVGAFISNKIDVIQKKKKADVAAVHEEKLSKVAAQVPASVATAAPSKKQKKKQRKTPKEDEEDENTQIFSHIAEAKPDEEEQEEESEEPASHVADEVAALRKSLRIFIKGADVPRPLSTFADLVALKAPQRMVDAIARFHEHPTPIQMQTIPIMLAERDVIGVAPTGSGKTLAFVVPLLLALRKPASEGFRACIVAPTRELAKQIKRELDKINDARLESRLLDRASASTNSFGPGSARKFDIVISTPMRLVHALKEGAVSLDGVRWLVLDEADRMFENGFEHQIDEIIASCTHSDRRIALFSATMPPRVEELANTVLQNPIRVTIGHRHAASEHVTQKLVFVGREDGKLLAVRQLIQQGLQPPVLVFVQSRARAQELFQELVYEGINVDVIHADRTQLQRDTVVKQFREGKIWVLICTDVMARGIDFKAQGVNLVINYDFPTSAVEYIHRIGRTGRAGRSGEAVTFFTEKDAPSLRSIVNVMRNSGCEVPEWMLTLKTKKHVRARVIQRDAISDAGKKRQEKTAKRK